MSKFQMQYKADTGNSAQLTGIESILMVETIDTVQLEGMTGKEIIELLEYDNLKNISWSIRIKDLPKEYIQEDDLHLINPDYINWLETQLETLTAQKSYQSQQSQKLQ